MCTIEQLKDKTTQITFGKKVVSMTQHLQAYVKHRLYIAEATGIIPKNMYCSNDFIDDAVATFYEQGINLDAQNQDIKIRLFQIVDNDLDDLFKREAFHQSTFSTSAILEEELESLEERFTIDEGLHLIMNDELDDISYKQDSKHWHLYLYADHNSATMSPYETDPNIIEKHNLVLGKFYSWLPLKVSNIVDLLVFGKLSFREIAQIKIIEEKRVERILNLVIKTFRNHLD